VHEPQLAEILGREDGAGEGAADVGAGGTQGGSSRGRREAGVAASTAVYINRG